MNKEEFIDIYVSSGMPAQHYEMMSKDLDLVIQDEIEKRLPSKEEIIDYAKKNTTRTEVKLGAAMGANWLKSKILKK